MVFAMQQNPFSFVRPIVIHHRMMFDTIYDLIECISDRTDIGRWIFVANRLWYGMQMHCIDLLSFVVVGVVVVDDDADAGDF